MTEVEVLRDEIAQLPGSKNTRRYSPELRARVIAWARGRRRQGARVGRLCKELGMGGPTLRRFLEEPRKYRVSTESAGFARLRLSGRGRRGRVDTVATPLVVRGPRGLVIEGLCLEDVMRLVERLSCSA